VGIVLVRGVSEQQSVPLVQPLDAVVPSTIEGQVSRDLEIPAEERAVAGMTNYVMRLYGSEGEKAIPAFTLYVGYYDSQMQGKAIHSPKNCLPGAGWEALAATTATVALASGTVTVNRYLIQRGDERALVLYWYHGRGRVAANEYAVKWDLLRDAALRGRSEEALVRVLVPVRESEEASFALAAQVARTVVPAVERALPTM
jgi:EpsI family protein